MNPSKTASNIVSVLKKIANTFDCQVAFSAILSRPVDFSITQPVVIEINALVRKTLKSTNKDMYIPFWAPYDQFFSYGQVIEDYYQSFNPWTGREDCLHLSNKGGKAKISQWFVHQGQQKPECRGVHVECRTPLNPKPVTKAKSPFRSRQCCQNLTHW